MTYALASTTIDMVGVTGSIPVAPTIPDRGRGGFGWSPTIFFDAVSVTISAIQRSTSLSWLDCDALANMGAAAPTAEFCYKILPPSLPTT